MMWRTSDSETWGSPLAAACVRGRRAARNHGTLRRRSGLAVPAVMLGIFLVGVFGLSMLQAMVQRHKVQRQEIEEWQCRLLLYSGLELAAARLGLDPEYPGELWRIDEAPLEAEVRIEVLSQPAPVPEERTVRVTARFPFDPLARIQLSEEFLVRIDAVSAGDEEDQ